MTLEETIIVAARSEHSAYELAYSSSRIDRQQMQRELPRNMTEALAEVPGVMVQKTANGQGSPFIRGFTGYRTLAMFDGVRYNNSVYRDGPNEYFSLIDSYSLDSIELLSGPASSLYGSDAIGGTLNVQSRSAMPESAGKELKNLTGTQHYRYSSAEPSHLGRSEIEIGELQEWGLLLGLSYKNFGDVDAADIGVQPKTGYQERAADMRFDRRLNERWHITALHQSLMQDDVWRTHSTVYGRSFAGTSVGDDQRRSKDHRRSLDYIKISARELGSFYDEIQLTLSYQRWREDSERVKAKGDQITEFFDSRMNGLDLQLSANSGEIEWVYGVDFYRDTVDTGRRDYLPDGSLDRQRIQGPVGDDSRYDLLGLYVQAELFTAERLSLSLGSRFTRTDASIGAYEDPATGMTASFDGDWSSTVSSVRASYLLDQHLRWRLWASISQSFRAPNIADISRYGKSRTDELEVAATNLSPENFLSYEIGTRAVGADYQVDASYFYTNIDDFINSTPTGRIIEGLTEVTKQNSAEGYIHGVEFKGSYQFTDSWVMLGNIAWLESRLDVFNQGSGAIVTEPMSRMMPLTAHLALTWNPAQSHWWFRFSATRAEKADKLSSGDRQDTQRIPPGGTPAYTLLAVSAGTTVNNTVDVTVALENVLDESYRSHGSGSNEPGRGLVVGLSMHF